MTRHQLVCNRLTFNSLLTTGAAVASMLNPGGRRGDVHVLNSCELRGVDYKDHGRIGEIVLFSGGKFMGPKPHEHAMDGSTDDSAVEE